MKRIVSIWFCFFFLWILGVYGDCPNNCGKRGTCEDDECNCQAGWKGDACDIPWRGNVRGWYEAYWIYAATTAAMQLAVTIGCIYQLYVQYSIKKATGSWPIQISIVLVGVILGSLFRIIYHVVDPFMIRDIFSPESDTIIFDLSLIFWLSVGFLLLLYWVELTRYSKIKNVQFAFRLKPFVLGFSIGTFVILIPIGLWKTTSKSTAAQSTYNAALSALLLILILMSSVAGIKLLRNIRGVYKSTKTEHFRLFLRKFTFVLLAVNAILISIIFTLIIFSFVLNNPWGYLTIQWILRIQEAAAMATVIYCVAKKKPQQPGSGSKETGSIDGSRGYKSDSMELSVEMKEETQSNDPTEINEEKS